MSTSYLDVYERALGLIDSYKFTKAASESPILFCRIMYPFLQGVFGQIVEPYELVYRLGIRKEPVYLIEDLLGDGVSVSFPLSFEVDSSIDNVFFSVELDGAILEQSVDYDYSSNTNSIIFTNAPYENAKIQIEYYYTGEIIGTENPYEIVTLKDHAMQLLASAVVKNWLEKNKNREILIKANISPKDYNMFSPANAIKENKDLYKLAKDDIESMQGNLSWRQKFAKAKHGDSHSLIAEVKAKL